MAFLFIPSRRGSGAVAFLTYTVAARQWQVFDRDGHLCTEVVSEIKLLCTKLAAEKRADERDSVLAKQLRKLYKEFILVDYLLNLL